MEYQTFSSKWWSPTTNYSYAQQSRHGILGKKKPLRKAHNAISKEETIRRKHESTKETPIQQKGYRTSCPQHVRDLPSSVWSPEVTESAEEGRSEVPIDMYTAPEAVFPNFDLAKSAQKAGLDLRPRQVGLLTGPQDVSQSSRHFSQRQPKKARQTPPIFRIGQHVKSLKGFRLHTHRRGREEWCRSFETTLTFGRRVFTTTAHLLLLNIGLPSLFVFH